MAPGAEYLTHYHKWSNVEPTFSMVKRKFGDSVRAKFVCRNICRVVSAIYELGIDPVFCSVPDTTAVLKSPGVG